MLVMNSRRVANGAQWLLAFVALAGIVSLYRFWLHVNPTTVALTLLLFILMLAARWGARFAVAASIAAAAAYNFYFLPPVGTFTISDPQNWLALFVFVATAVTGSRLSQRAREEAEQARRSQRELTVLLTLSRELLQTDNVAALVNILPELVNSACRADAAILYLLEGDRIYQAGLHPALGVEAPHFRQLALTLPAPETVSGEETRIPLRAGARPRGLLLLRGVRLSAESFEAMGGLVSIALDRAQALENVTRSEANRESERLRTLILDSITHELRTPLTSIKGAASAMLTASGTLTEDDRHELLTIVDEESDRLNRLVSRAVEMAQIEAQEIHMNFAPVSIDSLVQAAREHCSAVFSTHAVTTTVPHLPRAEADHDMISKVLCNLLENAAKYSRPGTPIFLSAEQQESKILIHVADRGTGIDPQEQPLIFDRLYRSRSQSGTTPGTGMGLAISRAIVEAHAGSLTVTSQLDHGSVFTFSLPIASQAVYPHAPAVTEP